jgi:UDP-N-acetylmuramoylalanine--D-glutamate ligase
VSRLLERLRSGVREGSARDGRPVHLIGLSSLEIADAALFLARAGVGPLVGHDLADESQLEESFRAAHIGMPAEAREEHWRALCDAPIERRLGAGYLAGVADGRAVVASQAWRLYAANEPLARLAAEGTLFVTPMVLAVELAQARALRTVGVTGSNGKSTTSNMVSAILAAGGVPAVLAGNYRYRGPVFADIEALPARGVLALEVSNHHLLQWDEALDVAVVTNVTPNHLGEHASFEEYSAVKERLVATQAAGGVAVLNADDPVSREFRRSARGVVRTFSVRGEADACLRDGALWLDGERLLARAELAVPGDHNAANALAAALATQAVGVERAAIAAGLRGFAGITGRLELMRELDGVGCYYDVESTTPESTIRALEAFPGRPVLLIAGGDDKGLDYEPLVAAAARHGARLFLLPGSATERILEHTGVYGLAAQVHESLEEALGAAWRGAGEGSALLLSPAAKGFYNRYLRGQPSFKRLVKRLRAAERGTES